MRGKGMCGTCVHYEPKDDWKGWCKVKKELVWGVTKWEWCHEERQDGGKRA